MVKTKIILLLAAAVLPTSGCEAKKHKADDAHWFTDARFGMFIHWSIPGVYDSQWEELMGKPRDPVTDRETMWSMKRGEIPVEKYEKLTDLFNPVDYDADKFAASAKAAGMKYIVITAKHHDGFAMFDSPSSTYDITDATPFGRDIMKELAAACHRHDLKMCFYYSHAQDWHHPHGAGNDWDYTGKKDFAIYFEEKCKPQVRELLTQYGPIGLIWFDTPAVINEQQSRELYELVKSIQPDCLVNSRIGNGIGDYFSTGDNQTAGAFIAQPWEVPATMNDYWSFKEDQIWKDPGELIEKLVEIANKGGNLLLNVGPDPKGVIPEKSIKTLIEIGDWLRINGEAIYGTCGSPLLRGFSWGYVTADSKTIYLHIKEQPNEPILLNGLKNKVIKAYFLDGGGEISFEQEHRNSLAGDSVAVSISKLPDSKYIKVAAIKFEGRIDVDTTPAPDEEGNIILQAAGLPLKFGRQGYWVETIPVNGAHVHSSNSSTKKIRLSSKADSIENWRDIGEWVSWNLKCPRSGTYDIVMTMAKRPVKNANGQLEYQFPGNDLMEIAIAGERLTFVTIENNNLNSNTDVQFSPGSINIDKPGIYQLNAKLIKLGNNAGPGPTLKTVSLTPAK
jgi:alpha-L-fucosidase